MPRRLHQLLYPFWINITHVHPLRTKIPHAPAHAGKALLHNSTRNPVIETLCLALYSHITLKLPGRGTRLVSFLYTAADAEDLIEASIVVVYVVVVDNCRLHSSMLPQCPASPDLMQLRLLKAGEKNRWCSADPRKQRRRALHGVLSLACAHQYLRPLESTRACRLQCILSGTVTQ